MTVPRCFLKRIPNGFSALFLWATSILLLLLLGFSTTAFARDPLIVYSQECAQIRTRLYYSQYQSGNWTTGTSAVTDPKTTWEQAWKVARIHPDKTKQVVVWKNGDSLDEGIYSHPSGTVPTGMTAQEALTGMLKI